MSSSETIATKEVYTLKYFSHIDKWVAVMRLSIPDDTAITYLRELREMMFEHWHPRRDGGPVIFAVLRRPDPNQGKIMFFLNKYFNLNWHLIMDSNENYFLEAKIGPHQFIEIKSRKNG